MTTCYDPAEGEQLKTEALDRLEAHRESLVFRGRRALLTAMLTGDGTATADDVRAAVDLPANTNPNTFGAVPGPLAKAGIIRMVSLRLSARPKRHAGLNRVWELADRAAALRWLANHPELPTPENEYEPSLFDETNETPAVVATGAY